MKRLKIIQKKIGNIPENQRDYKLSKWSKLLIKAIKELNQTLPIGQRIKYKNLGFNNTLQLWHEKDDKQKDLYPNHIIFGGNFSSFQLNNFRNARVCDNKAICSQLLRDQNLAVPSSVLYFKNKHYNHREREKELKKIHIDYPLVLKCIIGTGGTAVRIIPKLKDRRLSDKMFREAIDDLEKKFERIPILIEKFIKGEDYRIVCYKDKIIDICTRTKPYIIGDGKSPIKKLVKQYNKDNKRMGYLPIAKVDDNLLKSLKLELKSILPMGKRLEFNKISNFHAGGRLKSIKVSQIHPDNREMFKKINSILGTQFIGIDFLSSDISKSWKENKAGINEVNSQPYLGVNYLANGKSLDIYKKILSQIFNL